jgi:hypothetical protein
VGILRTHDVALIGRAVSAFRCEVRIGDAKVFPVEEDTKEKASRPSRIASKCMSRRRYMSKAMVSRKVSVEMRCLKSTSKLMIAQNSDMMPILSDLVAKGVKLGIFGRWYRSFLLSVAMLGERGT